MKILILCTGNSCRSIIAEGLVKKCFPFIEVFSAGSKPSGRVNENAKKILQKEGIWNNNNFYSKSIDEIQDKGPFDLVVTVCDSAKEECPFFPGKTIHVGFQDPDGKEFDEFEKLTKEMKSRLLPKIKEEIMINYATPKGNKEAKISLEEFIEKFNNDEAILVDIRMPFEKKVWNVPFALDIPADKLEENLDKLPKDKIIVIACPGQGRSPFATMFLKEKGFDARFLEKGLLNLMEKLKGGEAKKLKV